MIQSMNGFLGPGIHSNIRSFSGVSVVSGPDIRTCGALMGVFDSWCVSDVSM